MASSSRCYLLTICIMQLVVTIQRQVFDFLGYMWAPIIGNFFHIIAVILGFFGGYHCRPKYLTVYSVWMWIWLGWNIFTICFYLEVGTLSRDSDILNIGTESRSWWEVNGIGCQPMYNFTHTTEDHVLFSKPISIEGCLLEYYYVECIQAGVQCLLAVLGFIGAVTTLTLCTEEDDTFDFIGGFDTYTAYHSPNKTSHLHLQPIYSEAKYRSAI
ncbi:sodium/potassium-transporting ATPase subunit beta-1-interacting protein 1-like isoform X2 [Tachypleus tridentatus]|uniref:sodium/potassium-transporting ATPase subunit beta-1-interacting protein 1-like isoform X2 n=1 Tax=Tachypleus tridentatus TaxID=6853 RepID=UPI003FD29C50